MLKIKKGREPNSLVKHRKAKKTEDGWKPDYENYYDKNDVRKSTCSEQKGICCYCLCQIEPTEKGMKIEHFKSQISFPEFQLKYGNLLGACNGNEGQPGKLQHCDTFKKEKDLTYNPSDGRRIIQNMIWFGNDGTIGSDIEELDNELNKGLNLNIQKLKNNRKAVLQAFQIWLNKFPGQLTRTTTERLLKQWNGDSTRGNLEPYCQVVVYWLQRKLNRS